MSGYDINVSIIAVCPSCGNDLPSNSYFTSSRGRDDNPYEKKDRRVFITPCADCFEPRQDVEKLLDALADILPMAERCSTGGDSDESKIAKARAALAKANGEGV